jgi:hypothetical protein
MQVRWTYRRRARPGSAIVAVRISALLAVSALALSACGGAAAGSGGHTASGDAGKQCGTSRSAANVPVTVEVDRGLVSCSTAMSVEHDYAKAIDDGKAPGNGGGGPVPINGWTCSGFPTPQVLKTGDASKCVKGGTEILAIVPTSA